jgi:hypothetical protein
MPGGGTLAARGELRLASSEVRLGLTLTAVNIATAQPYLRVTGRLGGTASGELQVEARLDPLQVSVTGNVALDDGMLGDGDRMLAYARRIEAAGLDTRWPARAAVQRLTIRQPWALVERLRDGTVPLRTLVTPGPPGTLTGSATPSPSTQGASPPLALTVAALAIDNGFVRFVDATTTPRFVEETSLVTLTATALSTAATARSPISLAARLSGGAPIELGGTVGSLTGPLFLDLRGTLANFPLPRVNPYLEAFTGWVARRGALGLTVRYVVRDDRLDASNELVAAQPEVSLARQRDEVQRRIGVPLGALVTLLKDARGEVHLTVPVTGIVSARQFDFGEAVWDAVRKAAIGVLALPVSWIGQLLYTQDARIETIRIWPVYFEPGTTRLRREFATHAERLAAFLRDAPGLGLVLKPIATLQDVAALKRDGLRERLAAQARASGRSPDAEARRLFAARFPGRTAPAALDALLDQLAWAEPSPDTAVRALAERRVAVTRSALQSGGAVRPERLRAGDGVIAVESEGFGRVEFEIDR